MAFPQNFLDEIKNRIAVSDVVGRRVKLQRRGREYVGLSPFKQERTASFTVNDDKQFYHCFATGKHGSVFDFIMETEGLSFPEAVEQLARQAGLEMPERDPQAAQKAAAQATLIDVTEAAALWFQAQLKTPAAQEARAYLERRGVSAELIERFGIGYAPAGRTALMEHLTARQMRPDQIVEAGMAIQPDEAGRPPYDRFRERIIFPIHDARGRVIAFGGRAMSADAKAKYLNSPETPLFHKGSVLFNFARARQPAYDANMVLVAEGYMDVVGLARAGLNHAVAPLGTAITEDQIRLLWRLAPEPMMCLDGDEAGLRAAYRAIDRILPQLKPGFSMQFAILPPGKDPDDVVRDGGVEAMQEVLGRARSLIDLMWEREIERAPWDTPERAAALKQRLRAAVALIQDKDVRTLYGQEVKSRLDALLGSPNAPYGNQNRGQTAAYNRNPGRNQRGSWGHRRPQPATSELRRSDLGRGEMSFPRREALIVLAVLNHPALLLTQRDRFENLDLSASELDKLRFEIIDHYDHIGDGEAGLDIDALTGHLKGRGMTQLLQRLGQMPEARLLTFVRKESGLEEVLAAWLETTVVHHKLLTLTAEKANVQEELETELARDGTQHAMERLMAIQGEIAALERNDDSA
jgi:DNA primase